MPVPKIERRDGIFVPHCIMGYSAGGEIGCGALVPPVLLKLPLTAQPADRAIQSSL